MKAEFILLADLCSHGVKNYWRYRDDILIRGSRLLRTNVWSFVKKLFRYAGYFKLKVETVTYDSANFLSIDVKAGTIFYDTCAVIKESTMRARPLGQDSIHPANVHRRWAIQTLKSMMVLCSRCLDKSEVKNLFISRFKQFGASKELLEDLEKTEEIAYGTKRSEHAKVWWCVLPFHPCHASAVQKAVRGFNDNIDYRAILLGIQDTVPMIKISWRNAAPLIFSRF